MNRLIAVILRVVNKRIDSVELYEDIVSYEPRDTYTQRCNCNITFIWDNLKLTYSYIEYDMRRYFE